MGRRKRAIWERKWKRLDIVKAFASLFVHFLCLLAPFHFTWPALRVALVVYTVGGLGITVSYHRNLAHRSFKVPKWLEYLFAYFGLLAIQVRSLSSAYCDFLKIVYINIQQHAYIVLDLNPNN